MVLARTGQAFGVLNSKHLERVNFLDLLKVFEAADSSLDVFFDLRCSELIYRQDLCFISMMGLQAFSLIALAS